MFLWFSQEHNKVEDNLSAKESDLEHNLQSNPYSILNPIFKEIIQLVGSDEGFFVQFIIP